MIHLEIILSAEGGITPARAREVLARLDPAELAALPTRRADITGAVRLVGTIEEVGTVEAPAAPPAGEPPLLPRDWLQREAAAVGDAQPVASWFTGETAMKTARPVVPSGEICAACGSAALVRSGTCQTCQDCGQTTGCS